MGRGLWGLPGGRRVPSTSRPASPFISSLPFRGKPRSWELWERLYTKCPLATSVISWVQITESSPGSKASLIQAWAAGPALGTGQPSDPKSRAQPCSPQASPELSLLLRRTFPHHQVAGTCPGPVPPSRGEAEAAGRQHQPQTPAPTPRCSLKPRHLFHVMGQLAGRAHA